MSKNINNYHANRMDISNFCDLFLNLRLPIFRLSAVFAPKSTRWPKIPLWHRFWKRFLWIHKVSPLSWVSFSSILIHVLILFLLRFCDFVFEQLWQHFLIKCPSVLKHFQKRDSCIEAPPANPRRSRFENCFKSCFDAARWWGMSCAFDFLRNYWLTQRI